MLFIRKQEDGMEKVVRLACKPTVPLPKAKVNTQSVRYRVSSPLNVRDQYLDPIVSATYSEGRTVDDVCKALAPLFREPNAIV